MSAVVYLIPTTLGDTPIENVIPQHVKDVVQNTRFFIVEEIRTARRFISKLKLGIQIDTLTFYELNEHTNPTEVRKMLQPALDGNDIGIISEAGVPGVADPGADAVAEAHRLGIKVVPLVGPSANDENITSLMQQNNAGLSTILQIPANTLIYYYV